MEEEIERVGERERERWAMSRREKKMEEEIERVRERVRERERERWAMSRREK